MCDVNGCEYVVMIYEEVIKNYFGGENSKFLVEWEIRFYSIGVDDDVFVSLKLFVVKLNLFCIVFF